MTVSTVLALCLGGAILLALFSLRRDGWAPRVASGLLLLIADLDVIATLWPQTLSFTPPVFGMESANAGLILLGVFALGILGGAMLASPSRTSAEFMSSQKDSLDPGGFGGLGARERAGWLAIAFLLCLTVGLAAAAARQISLPHALLLAMFAVGALAALWMAVDALLDEPIELQSNWGGLGGGLGGWRLSRPAVLLLIGAALAAGAVTMGGPTTAREGRKPEANTANGLDVTLHVAPGKPADSAAAPVAPMPAAGESAGGSGH